MRIIAVLLLSAVLVSCQSIEPAFSREEAALALSYLSDDMMELASFSDVSESAFLAALPEEYTVYSDYLPLYASLADDYSSKLADIASSVIDDILPEMGKYTDRFLLEGSPESCILGDTSFTDALADFSGHDLGAECRSALEGRSDELEAAAAESLVRFREVLAAYSNLSFSGYDVDIPEPKAIDASAMSEVVADEIFRMLRDAEKAIKNNPVSSEGVYSIFWRR